MRGSALDDEVVGLRGPRLAAISGKLAVLNGFTLAVGLVTGPLLAHALGASGRGELAAVIVPASLLPLIMGFGLSAFATREAARGANLRTVAGSTGGVALVVGFAGLVLAIPGAIFLADGDQQRAILLGAFFVALPFNLCAQVIYGTAVGLSLYKQTTLSRMIPSLVSVVGLPILAVLGELSVLTAALVILAGGVLSAAPLVRLFRQTCWRPRYDRTVARRARSFGLRAWAGGLSVAATSRLDQLLMIKLVSLHQLGLYAVAVTVAALVTTATSSTTALLLPRTARGDTGLLQRTLRVLVLLLTALSVALMVIVPFALPVLFGADFSGAVTMTLILLLAAIPLGAAAHLAVMLTSLGYPATESIGQLVALAITIVGLPLLLPSFGGEGAAITSLVAYSANLAVLVHAARRKIGGTLRSYFIVTRTDCAWLAQLIRSLIGKRRRPGPACA